MVPGKVFTLDRQERFAWTMNRIKEFFGRDIRIVKAPKVEPKHRKKRGKKKKEITQVSIPLFTVVPYHLTRLHMLGKITTFEYVLIQIIDAFAKFRPDGITLECFWGSNEYLAKRMNCSLSTIERALSSLGPPKKGSKKKGKDILLIWTKDTIRDKFGQFRTTRYMCSKWVKDKFGKEIEIDETE
jgi:hypothetical protein